MDDDIGWRFKPNDQLLLEHFLRRKAEGKKLCTCNGDLIPEVGDLYGNRPPSEIFPDHEEHYVFTKLVKFSDGAKKINRKVKGGFWKLEKNDDVVIRSRGIIGKKKLLSFMSGEGKKAKATHWNMSEYTLPEWKHGDWVLCHVRFNGMAAAREEEKAAEDAARKRCKRTNVDEREDEELAVQTVEAAAAASHTFIEDQEEHVHVPALEWASQDPHQPQPHLSWQQQELETSEADIVAAVNGEEFMREFDSWELPDHDFFLDLGPIDCVPPPQEHQQDATTGNSINVQEDQQDATTGSSINVTTTMAEAFMERVDSWDPSDTFKRDLDAWAAEYAAKKRGKRTNVDEREDEELAVQTVEAAAATAAAHTFIEEQEEHVHVPAVEWACQDPVQPPPPQPHLSWQQQELEMSAADIVAAVNDEEFMREVDSWELPDDDFFLDLGLIDCVPPPQEDQKDATTGSSINVQEDQQDATTGSSTNVTTTMAEVFMERVDSWDPIETFKRDLDAWAAEEFAKMG